MVSHVTRKEGGPLSDRREYLRLERQHAIFDVCGAPFGTGFFVSEWVGKRKLRFVRLLLALVAISGALLAIRYMQYPRMRPHEINLALSAIGVLILACFVVAIWQGSGLDDLLMRMPGVRFFYARFFRRPSYYRKDLECVYRAAVHAAVLQVIDEIGKPPGVSPVSRLEREVARDDLLVGVGRKP
ncbi:MAG: hypothetical protein QM770_01870 [Tepidisphaeraceae bacterium]